MPVIETLFVAGLILIHLFAGQLRFLDVIPRSRWLSTAGGTAVAYVFLHVFPELQEAQGHITEASDLLPWIEHHAYLVALCGVVVFYGLERRVKSAQRWRREQPDAGKGETTTGTGVFWLHIVSFSIYNALFGYLLAHRAEQSARELVFFFVAVALHFLVNDYGLQQDHKDTYRRTGRWVLAAGIVAGWALGLATQISMAAIGTLSAFLAGGVVLNVLKEELPEERQSRFLPFLLGVAGYAALLLLA